MNNFKPTFYFFLICLFSNFSPYIFAQSCNNVTTFAGQSASGTTDGSVSVALFNRPRDLAFDKDGNLYIADGHNHTIRKITPNGIVSTFAGMPGVSGYQDGMGTNARFENPVGLVFGKDGNLYVADVRNNRIRKISPAGEVTTFAGSGSGAYAEGTGVLANLPSPKFIDIDQQGTLYVPFERGLIAKITIPNAVVSTFVGTTATGSLDDTGTAARFQDPSGMAFDTQGNMYVADLGNNTIRKVTPAGVVTTLTGLAGVEQLVDGTLANARFENPRDLIFDADGNLLIGQGNSHEDGERVIRKITPDGMVSTLAGMTAINDFADGVGTAARFSGTRGMAFDASGQKLYIADVENHRIRLIDNCPLFPVTAPLAPIPTFSQWGLLIFGLLILNLSIFSIYLFKGI